jgi:hypothetical protein
MLDINDAIENGNKFESQHLVYKDGVQVKYPNKNAEIVVGILPAVADPEDMTSYLPYRDAETSKFTKWATPAIYYPFINKDKSIISLKTFDRGAIDPIEELIEAAKSSEEFAVIAGYEPGGKKRLANAFDNPKVRIPHKTQIFCVNCIILFDRDVDERDVYILQVPSTAFKGQAPSSDGAKNSGWGLINKLNMTNRGSHEGEADFEQRYYWGDITNPKKIVPVSLSQQSPPTGSKYKIYDMSPMDDEDTVTVPSSVLKNRYLFDEIFAEPEPGEIIDYLIHSFADVPDLLTKAFANKVPNISKLIKAATASYSIPGEDSLEEGEEDFDLPTPSRKGSKAATAVEDEAKEEEETPTRRFSSPAPKAEADEDEQEEDEEKVVKDAPRKSRSKSANFRNLIED